MSIPNPIFQRAPRIFPTVPTQEIEIQDPPPVPGTPTSSLVAVLLPLGFTILALGISAAFMATNASYLLLSVPLMLGSGLVGIINYINGRKENRNKLEKRERVYIAHLDNCQKQLNDLATQQRQASLDIHPDFDTCLAIAQRRTLLNARHLWERSSGIERSRDPDFLQLRLGIGNLPATFHSKPPPSRPPVGEENELYEKGIQLAQEFQQVDGVAVYLPLEQVGSAGIAGTRDAVLDNCRSLMIQLATLHSPNEVKIVCLLPQFEISEWDWIRWLPHVWDDERKSRLIATTLDEERLLLSALFQPLQRRAMVRSPEEGKSIPSTTFVFLFADSGLFSSSDTSVIGPMLHFLFTQGPSIGAYSLFLGARPESLPSACGALVDINPGNSKLRIVGPPTQEIKFAPDRVGIDGADRFARSLAPVQLKQVSTQSDLPSNVSLTELLQISKLEDYPYSKQWNERDSWKRVEVPLGIESGGGIVSLNFQETARKGDGTHALVGGTIGTGKTRFLQMMITLLAAHHHPLDVNFILIDYKGGDLIKGVENLPHVVGSLSNLAKQKDQEVLIGRLFVCLEAELLHRRILLDELEGGAEKSINLYQQEYLKGKVAEPLSHLFVVIDEFAEMIRNSPDRSAMSKRLLSIGATGRSCGVHLILATQDPAGIVTDELRNNINIRLCLRMGSRDASMSLLHLSDAYDKITGIQAGRAFLQVGNNDRFVPFQAAWGGDKYTPGKTESSGLIAGVLLNGQRIPLRPSNNIPSEETQIGSLVAHIAKVAEDEDLNALRHPLSPPMREIVFLDELRIGARGWNNKSWDQNIEPEWPTPYVGLVDNPSSEKEKQFPFQLPLGKVGNFALYGESDTGKSVFTQTLVTSLAQSYSPADLNIYLIDFRGQRMLSLIGFPHVGDVFTGDDLDRLKRLFRFLDHELQNRKVNFAKKGASNLNDFRKQSKENIPAIVIVLDDFAAFHKTCQDRNIDLEESLYSILSSGGSYGLHLVLIMNDPSDNVQKTVRAIKMAATYRLATSDYSSAVGPTGGMEPTPAPGRGLLKGKPPLEFQTALPVRGQTTAERSIALQQLMGEMKDAWSGKPLPVSFPSVPSIIGLSQIELPNAQWEKGDIESYSAVFAINLDDPSQPFPVNFQDGPYFLVAGTPQSGKTTLLVSWILKLVDKYAPEKLILNIVDFHHGGLLPLCELPQVTASILPAQGLHFPRLTDSRYIYDKDTFGLALAEISEIMQDRQNNMEAARQKGKSSFSHRAWVNTQSLVLMVIDDYDIFKSRVDKSDMDLMDECLRKWRDLGFALIVAGSIADFENAWGWISQLKDASNGFQLGTGIYNQIFKVNNLPVDNPAKTLLPGNAFYIRRGQFHRVKIGDPHIGPVLLEKWIENIRLRQSSK